jgi:hypothetical protein
MPFWDVSTPICQHERCDTPEEVRGQIAEYMAAEGASLNNVHVIHVPQTGNTTAMGSEVSPYDFWQPQE